MRHVLLTADAVGGVFTYALDLASGLAARGVRVSLALLGPASAASVAAAREVAEVYATGLPLDWTAADADTLRSSGASLAGLARRLRVDAVHLHTPALAAEIAWGVPVVAVAHSDVGTWWQAVRGGRLPDDLAWRAHAVAVGLAEAAAVIAPSDSFAVALEALYRPGRSIEVVRNGRAIRPVPAMSRTDAVLAAGRLWDEGKNLALLDQVAARLDAPIVAAGPLEGFGASIGFDHLETTGALSPTALAARMAASSVFVSAARYEPFGLAVLEAAQSGMALALSDIPTHRELWGGAALFFHPDDAGGCADVLRRLLADPGAAAARACARATEYGVDAMVEGTLAVHADAARQRAA